MSKKKEDMDKAIELLHKKFPNMSFTLMAYSEDLSMVRTTVAYRNLGVEDIPLMEQAVASLMPQLRRLIIKAEPNKTSTHDEICRCKNNQGNKR